MRKFLKKSKHIIRFLKNSHLKRKKLLEEKGLFCYVKDNSGFILIVVLIISSMLLIAMSDFLLNAQININYLSKFRDESQAEPLAETGFNLAKLVLELDKSGKAGSFIKSLNSDTGVDSYNDLWALDLPEITLETGSIKIVIDDEQGKINLNSITTEFVENTPYYNMLNRFFLNMGFPQDMPDSIADWMDADNNRRPYGAETYDYYSSLPGPYTAKNAPFDSIDELLLVKGFTPEIFYGLGGGNSGKEENIVDSNRTIKSFSFEDISLGENSEDKNTKDENKDSEEKETNNKIDEEFKTKIGKEKSRRLIDYFRVYGDNKDYLGESNKININTATFRVLMSISGNTTEDKITELIRRRQKKPILKIDDVADLIDEDAKKYITLQSQIFSIKATGKVNNHSIIYYGFYNRETKKVYFLSIQ